MADSPIYTRFKIEGEQEYRKAMSDAANAVKVLNSQQKLAKAQFQNTGNAEKYAAQQAEILQKKIEQQKNSVKAAEAALKQLSEQGVAANNRQMQQWQMKLNSAQTALEQMEAELKEVNGTMQETGSTAQETGDAVESIGKKVSFDAVIGGLGKITGAMSSAAQKAKELSADLINTMMEAAAWSDDLATKATVYGISTEELQRMQYTADLIDASVESIMKSRQKLVNNMVYGNDEIQESFRELGVTTQEMFDGKYGEVAGQYRDWEDVFWDLGEALMNMEDVELRNATANKLLGKSFEELLPLFDNDWAEKGYASAREYYEATKNSWQVVSDENIARLNALDDTVHTVENNFNTLKGTILGELAPAFTQVGDTIAELLAQFNEYLNSEEGQQKLSELSDAVTGLFEGLTNVDFGAAMETAKGALEALTDGLGWIKENWGAVEIGLKALAGAFGAMKVTESVLTFMQLLASGKFLFGGGKGGAAAAAGGGSSAASAAAGAAGGGMITAIQNAITGAAASAGSAWASAGASMTAGPVADWFMYQTDIGRYLRGEETWDDVLKSVQDFGDAIQENAETFQEDWANNPIVKFFQEGFETNGRNAMALWNSLFPQKQQPVAEIEEDVNLDNEPLINLSPSQWEAAQRFWDAYRESAIDAMTGPAREDLYSQFKWTEEEQNNFAQLISLMESLKTAWYGGEDLPDWWVNRDLWPKDEPMEVPAEPELEPDSQELLQQGLNMLTLRLPVTPYLTSDSWLPFYPHANGLPYVPFDGYPAVLHKGERVVPAREVEAGNRTFNSNMYVEQMYMNNGTDVDGLASKVAAENRRVMAGFGS